MTKLEKSLCRHLRDTCNKTKRRKFQTFITICLLLILWKLFNQANYNQKYKHSNCDPIDVVYTWVNGTDPDFIDSVRRYDREYDPSRFDDKQELRFSLRSLELHAPWVRHVYIVTNGQIPHWLDLSYDRVTVVPHEILAPYEDMLPTFSSAAIETFIHRIPKLSKRFLYLNDDIFLGATLFPEDLYTEADGVHVYNAWTVPDCANDCPWAYIGDGACDQHCNIAECQFDGGDCELDAPSIEKLTEEEDGIASKSASQRVKKRKRRNMGAKKIANKSASLSIDRRYPKSQFKDVLKRGNLSTLQELQGIVNSYNKGLKRAIHPSSLFSSTTFYPKVEPAAPLNASLSTYKSSKDIYSKSLIHTNMLLNRHYGFKGRNVLAHVGFLFDRDIIDDMHLKFSQEIAVTVTHRFRASDDLQYAFMYYSFLMSETYNASVGEIFDEFDTDASHTWSDREVRTFLARMYPLPLDWSAVRYFEEVIGNCSKCLGHNLRSQNMVYPTLVYERYEDSNVPTITRSLVARCELLAEALMENFATRQKYKFSIANSVFKRGTFSNFMMLTSNVTEVVDALDRIRRKPKKFNCVNDNLEPQYHEENDLIRHLLEDFYLSFFPRRSKFELHEHFRNRFTNWHDYERWRLRKIIALFVGYIASAFLTVFLLRFLCFHKAKLVRRYVQKL